MKKIFFIFCFIIIALKTCYAQQVIEWQKNFGGTGDDLFYDIQQTVDSGFIAAGFTYSNDGNVSGNNGSRDAWVVKVSSSGNLQWQKCLGGTDDDWAFTAIQTAEGGYIMAGVARSDDGDVSGIHGVGISDEWVVKLNNSGNIEWQKCLGGTGYDGASAILQIADGGYIVAGSAGSNNGDITGFHGGLMDSWIVKLDSSGTIQWQKCLGGTNEEYATSIQPTDDGGYILTSPSSSDDGDVSGNHGFNDYWVVKLDSSANIQWQKCLGGTSSDGAYSAQQTTDGGYIVSGLALSDDGDLTGNQGSDDAWIVKLDSSGTIQWQKSIAGSGQDDADRIRQTADGGYIFGGISSSNDVDVTGNHGGGGDAWIVKLDSSGNMQWQKCMGGTDYDWAYSLQITTDGGYVLGGMASSDEGDVNGNHGHADSWIIKLTGNYNLITGKLFIDGNSNQVQDVNEPTVNNHRMNELISGRFNYSQQNGLYAVSVLDSGNFTIAPSALSYYNPVPPNYNLNFSAIQQEDSLNDFAFQSAGIYNDLCVQINPVSAFSPGFYATYMITYENVGTTTLTPTVIFFPDADVSYVNASVTPSSITTDSIAWNFGPLDPYQTGNILVTVAVNTATAIGTLINSSVEIDPILGDANTECNTNVYDVYVTASYDPNAILVDRDTVLTTELSSPPYLNYIVYFQNTGNAPAVNVKVLNNISGKLDMNSFEFIASSHPVNINYKSYSRLMEFNFDNILLADSNANEPASHGFIHYRIKPRSNLVAGNIIYNRAAIYFDFNQPVLTDYATTEIVLPVGISGYSPTNQEFSVFPNPANGEIKINNEELKIKEITIVDVEGRKVLQQKISKQQTIINIKSLLSGIYILEIESGNNPYRLKLVKQ
ncbi:MAG TPA: T9SS type A sorting domain-containing protein [Bacteroidia bacterium]|nr:T9SS type A sorting domain-containing protein [Bacteroidia bacterium]